MASQRITIAMLVGVSGEVALRRLTVWSSARSINDTDEWSHEQWPGSVRTEVDEFAERVRANGFAPPVGYFAEWADLWSMGDLFTKWLTPPTSAPPIQVYANRFTIHAYRLPDEGRLSRYLGATKKQQWPESNWFIARLREAVTARYDASHCAALIVLREVFGGLVDDSQIEASQETEAPWLT